MSLMKNKHHAELWNPSKDIFTDHEGIHMNHDKEIIKKTIKMLYKASKKSAMQIYLDNK